MVPCRRHARAIDVPLGCNLGLFLTCLAVSTILLRQSLIDYLKSCKLDETESFPLMMGFADGSRVETENVIVEDEDHFNNMVGFSQAEEKKLVRKIDLFLLPTIWLMYLLSYMDRTKYDLLFPSRYSVNLIRF